MKDAIKGYLALLCTIAVLGAFLVLLGLPWSAYFGGLLFFGVSVPILGGVFWGVMSLSDKFFHD